jgi:hypothetical protein
MWRTYTLCEPILAYIRNDWAWDVAKLHWRTASETVQSNDNGSFFVKHAPSGGWWCEIKPAAENVASKLDDSSRRYVHTEFRRL